MTAMLNPSAVALWKTSIDPRDKILVTGATGWFGRTALALLEGLPNEVFSFAGKARNIQVGRARLPVNTWDRNEIEKFEPNLVIDCAFITREFIADMSLDKYFEINKELIANLLWVSSLPSVRGVLAISSGAAVYPSEATKAYREINPYGYLKHYMELEITQLGEALGLPVTIARPWSVSGAYITKPSTFAISNLILQAQLGDMKIQADKAVFRRYSAIEDLLAFSLAELKSGGVKTINSEGELVEIFELAQAIKININPESKIHRTLIESTTSDEYYPRTNDWQLLGEKHNLQVASLDEQIRSTALGLAENYRHPN